jgi:hypothetical protein
MSIGMALDTYNLSIDTKSSKQSDTVHSTNMHAALEALAALQMKRIHVCMRCDAALGCANQTSSRT